MALIKIKLTWLPCGGESEGDKRSQENSLEVLQFKLREEILESRERHQVEQINNWSNI